MAILRPGDSQLQPLLVPPSEAVDAWAAHPSELLLQHGGPGLELTTPLPAPMRGRHWVDDVVDDFASRTASSMSEPSEPALLEYWRQGAEVKAMTQNFTRELIVEQAPNSS